MRTTILAVLALVVGSLTAGVLVSQQLAARHALELARQQEAWAVERSALEAALRQAKEEVLIVPPPKQSASAAAPSVPTPLSPAEILERLIELSSAAGAPTRSSQREIVYWLEELAWRGPAALPAIEEFLERYEDLELDTAAVSNRSARHRLPEDFLFPPSLRFGLFDVVQRIGGPRAEDILAGALNQTGRGVEVAYLTRILQEMNPDQHRAAALAVAHRLLAQPDPQSTSPLDRYHRDQLYAVLAFFQDDSYATLAQAQLVSAEGRVDAGALRYVQQALGVRAVSVAAQTYQDPRLTNSAAKEPFARLALAYAGVDAQADQFYQQAINDNLLTPNHRRNLIEDLNQEGFADTRNLTANDLPLIENRIALIEQLAPGALDDVNAAAFQEAYKDLLNMRAKVTGAPPAEP